MPWQETGRESIISNVWRNLLSAPGTFKDGGHNLVIFLFVVDAFILWIRLNLADMTTQNQPQKKVRRPEIVTRSATSFEKLLICILSLLPWTFEQIKILQLLRTIQTEQLSKLQQKYQLEQDLLEDVRWVDVC